ncbi:MAG: sigma-54 dependent transcriptional regulator [Deltaproteobacteria bacterium]|jgi:two-component system nitrogen regulation response regulator NtrX|nr:sigma-54 dependent transcriptional regulator [Deltaproteobacteria bacterium]
MKKILVIDDEKNIRTTLKLVLEGEGYQLYLAETGAKGLKIIKDTGVSLVLLDLKLKGTSGFDILKKLKTFKNPPAVVVISGQASTTEAMKTIKEGAFDFLEKPLDRSRILATVDNALRHHSIFNEDNDFASKYSYKFEMIGESPPMLKLFQQIQKIAPTRGRVLITGESGTGKELIARAIHKNSSLAANPFIKINCAAIPAELIESELFGHEKGAFTGASSRKSGLFEQAHNGTIFLDEIADMSLNAQAKVLRVLQSGEFVRVGGENPVKVEVRVIAATNRDLEKMVQEEKFREDLYFRLSVLPIKVPHLRKRKEDIPLLVNGFIKQFCNEYGLKEKMVDSKVIEILQQQNWPGNIRELKNQVERMVILSSDIIGVKDLPIDLVGSGLPSFELNKFSHLTLKKFMRKMESSFIKMKLEEHDWNITKTASILDIERTNLHKKINSLEIERDK